MAMEKDAAKAMAEEVLAGAVLASRGTGGRIAGGAIAGNVINVAGVAGAAASMLGADALASKKQTPVAPGDHKGFIFVAAGRTKVGFFEMKRGLIGNSLGRLLVELPRDEVVRFQVDQKGITTSAVDVEIKDGTVYGLEVARANRGKAQRVQRELGF